jgi:hypothetical protein
MSEASANVYDGIPISLDKRTVPVSPSCILSGVLSVRDDEPSLVNPMVEEIQSTSEAVLLPLGKACSPDSSSGTSSGASFTKIENSTFVNPVIEGIHPDVSLTSGKACIPDSPSCTSLGVSFTKVESSTLVNPAIEEIQSAPEDVILPSGKSSTLDSPSDISPGTPFPAAPASEAVSMFPSKPSIEFQRPSNQSSKTPIPAVPLSKLSDFLPTGEKWDKRWEGESEANHKQRTSKQRSDWIRYYTSTMKKGTTKAKQSLRFYQDLVKSGRPPQPFQKPQPVETQGPSQLAIFERLTGDDWTLRWEGESMTFWQERHLMGKER